MPYIKLKNTTGGMAKVGSLVKIDPNNKNAFQYVTDLTGLPIVGTIAQTSSPGSLTWIRVLGSPSSDNVITVSDTPPANPRPGDIWVDTTENLIL